MKSRCTTNLKPAFILGAAVTATGCVGPLVDEFSIDPEMAKKLREEIPTASGAQLNAPSTQKLGVVEATSCFNNFITDDMASEEAALDQLRYNAQSIGANAIANPTCRSEGTNIAKNCWSSVSCRAMAVVLDGAAGRSDALARSGTCFAVGPNTIVTAAHVVDGTTSLEARFLDGTTYQATLVSASRSNDVAVLSIEGTRSDHLALQPSSRVSAGSRVFSIGFPAPDVLGSSEKYTDGAISSLSGVRGDASLMQITIPIQPGSSGSPVATEDGGVVGMVTSSAAVEAFIQTTGALPQNVNWAVKSDFILPLLGSAPGVQDQESLERDEAIAAVRSSTCQLIGE